MLMLIMEVLTHLVLLGVVRVVGLAVELEVGPC